MTDFEQLLTRAITSGIDAEASTSTDTLVSGAEHRLRRRRRVRGALVAGVAVVAVAVPLTAVAVHSRPDDNTPTGPTTEVTTASAGLGTRVASWRQARITVPGDWADAPFCDPSQTYASPPTVRRVDSFADRRDCASAPPRLGVVFQDFSLIELAGEPDVMTLRPATEAGQPDVWVGYTDAHAPNQRGIFTSPGIFVTTLDHDTGQAILDSLGVDIAAPDAPPGSAEVVPLADPVVVTRTGTFEIEIGEVPEGATDVALRLQCHTGGRFEYPGGYSTCPPGTTAADAPPATDERLDFATLIPLRNGRNSVTITAPPGAEWEAALTVVRAGFLPWGVNEAGQTYGVNNDLGSPDLVLVRASNGKSGYCYTRDMVKNGPVPVYESDGVTRIGTFGH